MILIYLSLENLCRNSIHRHRVTRDLSLRMSQLIVMSVVER